MPLDGQFTDASSYLCTDGQYCKPSITCIPSVCRCRLGPHITSTNASLTGNSTGDFFLPAFQCPHKVQRVGTLGDGGKWVCGLEKVAEKRKPCVIYSVGTQRTA